MILEDLAQYNKVPTYVGVKLDDSSVQALMELAKHAENRVSPDDIHITVAYSKAPISMQARGNLKPSVVATPKEYSIFKGNSGGYCLVLEVDAPELTARHNEIIRDYGASHDYPTYRPHITLSYNCGGGFDLRKMPPVHTLPRLFAIREYRTELNTNWGN